MAYLKVARKSFDPTEVFAEVEKLVVKHSLTVTLADDRGGNGGIMVMVDLTLNGLDGYRLPDILGEYSVENAAGTAAI